MLGVAGKAPDADHYVYSDRFLTDNGAALLLPQTLAGYKIRGLFAWSLKDC